MILPEPLVRLFFPDVCPACGGPVGEGSKVVCTLCHLDAPLTFYAGSEENPVRELLSAHIPVVHASAFMFYTEHSRFRRLIYGFKYGGGWRLALQTGEWYGRQLAEGGLYGDVDVVMPIPLHPGRLLSRGYNQAAYLAAGISRALGKGTDVRSVRRTRNNPRQALTGSAGRWANVDGIFAVRNPRALEGRHILLVDDVLTTGATAVSCAEAILRAVPSARISVAALAVSKKGVARQ